MTRVLAIPGIHTLRELRHLYARGGMPPLDRRSPEDWARIAAFRTLEELLRLLEHFKRRIERGERCRLVEREQAFVPGRLCVEIVIEEMETKT